MAKKKPETIYQIRISLDHIRPPIWRRVLVPGSYTLADLHVVVQIAMGWEFSHLHAFTIAGQSFSSREEMEFDEFEDMEDETRFRLMDVVEEGSRFEYEYDFGDSWEHTLQVEKVFPAEEGQVVPVCIKGKRACPPEDVGGIYGYQEFLEALANPDDPEHEEYLEWVDGSFDPEAFDMEEINKSLAGYESGDWDQLTTLSDISTAQETAKDLMASEEVRSKLLSIPQLETVKSLLMVGMMNAMLTYIRDNKVTGTKSKGNFPRKAVLGMIERSPYGKEFLSLIGSAPGNFRTEEEILPVYYVHLLAAEADLIVGGSDKQWKLTPAGEAFLNDDPRFQLCRMFFTWWYEINWMIMTPLESFGFEMTKELRPLIYQSLISLPVDEKVPFQQYIQPFLEDQSMPFGTDRQVLKEFLASLLSSVILLPLQGLGIVSVDMEELQPDSVELPTVREVKLTPLGKEYLSLLTAQ